MLIDLSFEAFVASSDLLPWTSEEEERLVDLFDQASHDGHRIEWISMHQQLQSNRSLVCLRAHLDMLKRTRDGTTSSGALSLPLGAPCMT